MLRLLEPRVCAATLMTAAVLTAGPLAAEAGVGPDTPRPAMPKAPPRPATPGRHALVVLLRDHVVHAAPDAQSRRIGAVAARRPLTRVHTRLPVLGRSGAWVHVRLPGRPNGHAGWISADRTRRGHTDWLVTMSVRRRLVTVFHQGRVRGRFRAVVGRPSTPTPRGTFFIEEIMRLPSIGAPYALALSARSNVYQQFGGGPGQVALHGTTGLGDPVGTAASHGCVRLSPRAMRWLARRVGPGTPLTVRR
jgi:hypothetical protein